METITYDLGNYELDEDGTLIADGAYMELTDDLLLGLDCDGDFYSLQDDTKGWDDNSQPVNVEQILEPYNDIIETTTWEMARDLAAQLNKSVDDTDYDEICCCTSNWWNVHGGSANNTLIGRPFANVVIYGFKLKTGYRTGI